MRFVLATLLIIGFLVLAIVPSGVLPVSGAPHPTQTGPVWGRWSRDADGDRLDDELEYRLDNAPGDSFPVIVCFDRMPGPREKGTIGQLGGSISFASGLLPFVCARLPRASIAPLSGMDGVARLEASVPLEFLLDTSIPAIGVDTVWRNYGLRGEGTTICVIDSGIDGNHSSLNDIDDANITSDQKIIAFYDAASSPEVTDGAQRPFDEDGHGTHVASVAAGTGDGSPAGRYIGVAPAARLVGVKIVKNATTEMTSDDAIRGIEWAISNKNKFSIDIISMSFGSKFLAPGLTNDGNSAISQLANKAVAEGIVCVAAAGNSGPARRSISPPGDARDVITVGNVNDDGTLNPSSSRGPVGRFTNSYTKPDVCAPGTDIYSAEANSDDKFVASSGTSDACPHVSGVAAMMLQASGALRPSDVMSILRSTADPKKSLPWQTSPNNDYGWGVVNAPAAVENCTNGTLPPVVFVNPLERANGTVTVTGTASSAHGTIQSVEVRVDSGGYSPAQGTSRWTFGWATKNFQNGVHYISARAFDGQIYSYEHRITVIVDNLLVTIVPISQSILISGELVLSGSTEGPGVSAVEVKLDKGNWQKADDTADQTYRTWQYRINTTKLSNGKHQLFARACDGNRYSDEASVEFAVENKNSPAPKKLIAGISNTTLTGAVTTGLLLAAVLFLGYRRFSRNSQ